MRLFIAKFLGLLLGLSFVYQLDSVTNTVVLPWNGVLASISYHLLHLFDNEVLLVGDILHHPHSAFSVQVASDCNGMEATLIFLSGVLAFPAGLPWKVAGVWAGFLVIQALNVVRIITLFYVGQWDKAIFDWTHKYLWPAIIILAALMVFLAWIRLGPGARVKA